MSDRLNDFLALPNVQDITEEVFLNKRLGKFVIKPMGVRQHKSYQNRCRGKANRDGVSFDSTKFNMLIVTNQVVSPDFSKADFLTKAGFNTAEDFIEAKLLPGEVAELASKICEISGFNLDINEDIDNAKNS